MEAEEEVVDVVIEGELTWLVEVVDDWMLEVFEDELRMKYPPTATTMTITTIAATIVVPIALRPGGLALVPRHDRPPWMLDIG